MGPPWSCRPQFGHMLAPWTLLSGGRWASRCFLCYWRVSFLMAITPYVISVAWPPCNGSVIPAAYNCHAVVIVINSPLQFIVVTQAPWTITFILRRLNLCTLVALGFCHLSVAYFSSLFVSMITCIYKYITLRINMSFQFETPFTSAQSKLILNIPIYFAAHSYQVV